MGSSTSKQNSKHITSFVASYAPTNRATCKRCKKGIDKGVLRLTRKEVPNDWTGDKGAADMHYHFDHGLEAVANMRCTQTNKWDQTGSTRVQVHGLDDLRSKDRDRADKGWKRAVEGLHSRCSKMDEQKKKPLV